MFGIGKSYKFHIKGSEGQLIFYTGLITEETATHIKVDTLRGETVLISISDITLATEMKE